METDQNQSEVGVFREQVPREYRLAGLVFYAFIFVVGIAVNLTALWVFGMTTKRRNSVTVYMINVAVVDLIFIVLLPLRMTYDGLDRWPFGDTLCRISAALTAFYPGTALWLFALISADRYVAVVQPRHSRELRDVRKAAVSCVGVWVMTLGVSAPLLFTGADDPDRATNFTTCARARDIIVGHQPGRDSGPMSLVRLACFFLVPVCIMVCCHTVVAHSLVHGRASRLKPEARRKSVRIIVALTAQVLLCFLPFHVFFLVRLLGVGVGHSYSTWAAFTIFLMSMSTVLDVILYYIVSKKFQDRVVSVIFYRNYLRSVRRKAARTGSVRSQSIRSHSNLASGVI